MSDLTPYTQIPFGDTEGLTQFFFAHRLNHIAIDHAIITNSLGNPANSTIDSQEALNSWIKQMNKPDETEDKTASILFDWLTWHDNLHQAEYNAFGLGESPSINQFDTKNPGDFYNWMYLHAQMHEILNQAAGIV